MNIRFLFLLIVVSNFFSLNSCQGYVQRNSEADIIGFWEGTYTTVGRPDLEPQYINFLIKADGTITNESRFLSEIRINIGTWELSENTLRIQVSNVYGGEIPNPQNGTAEFDPGGFLNNGSIKNLSGTGAAEFEMVKRK